MKQIHIFFLLKGQKRECLSHVQKQTIVQSDFGVFLIYRGFDVRILDVFAENDFMCLQNCFRMTVYFAELQNVCSCGF